jgi:archaellum component FlaC
MEDRYKDLRSEFIELQEANTYMKQLINEKDDYIEQLEAKKQIIQKVYEPVSNGSYTPDKQRDSFGDEKYQMKLNIVEEENERLREQAFKADKEVERLRENIIIREREIHNIRKSIAVKEPNINSHKSNTLLQDVKNKSKPSDFMLSMETNPNLVNDFAKMSGSSGFKYGQKGPYDESLEKLRKEFSLQQKEHGLETLSEISLSAKNDGFKSPTQKTFALMMGQSNIAPTGDLRVDYEAVYEEKQRAQTNS